MNNSLKRFQNKYLLDSKTFVEESNRIRMTGRLPDDLSHQWQFDIACIDETLYHENGSIRDKVYDEYLNTLIDFLTPRYDLLVNIKDYYNAFDISYCSFFACIENVDRSYLDSNPTWRAFETDIIKKWNELFLQISEEDIASLWNMFWNEFESLLLSGVYKQIAFIPYLHFLTLPWPEKYKSETETILNHLLDNYGLALKIDN